MHQEWCSASLFNLGHGDGARRRAQHCRNGWDITTIKQTQEKLLREIVERTRAMEQRTEAQRELAASEGKLRKIFEVSPDSISIVRMADGEILVVNEKLCAMTGLSEELIGRKAAATGIWIKADLKRFRELCSVMGRHATSTRSCAIEAAAYPAHHYVGSGRAQRRMVRDFHCS